MERNDKRKWAELLKRRLHHSPGGGGTMSLQRRRCGGSGGCPSAMGLKNKEAVSSLKQPLQNEF
ncbi:MAG: hypothetical protein JW932_11045 [Deltaproteobacteria bacterium]|nr:hypothetical protein [Deltaproteobacteria bacterium]